LRTPVMVCAVAGVTAITMKSSSRNPRNHLFIIAETSSGRWTGAMVSLASDSRFPLSALEVLGASVNPYKDFLSKPGLRFKHHILQYPQTGAEYSARRSRLSRGEMGLPPLVLERVQISRSSTIQTSISYGRSQYSTTAAAPVSRDLTAAAVTRTRRSPSSPLAIPASIPFSSWAKASISGR
jgi:hypothetical protein